MSEKKESVLPKLILVFIGAILGFGADFFLDFTSYERQSKAYRLNDVVDKRFNTFEELSKMTGERLYVTRQLLGVKQRNENEKKYVENYNEVVRKWNIEIYRFYALIDNLYDNQLRKEYESKVDDPLVNIGKKIRYRGEISKISSRKLDTISMNVLVVDKLLLERLHEEKNLLGNN